MEKVKRKPMERDKFIKSMVESLTVNVEVPGAPEIDNDGVRRKRARDEAETTCAKVCSCTCKHRRRCKNYYNRYGVICKQNTGFVSFDAHLCVDYTDEWHERRLDEKQRFYFVF